MNTTLKDLYNQSSLLSSTDRMPCVFIGHGSPMNVVEENSFTQAWTELNKNLPVPSAIVCISAHWETKGTFVTGELNPKTIHDFYGFPRELYMEQYPAPGLPSLAQEVIDKIKDYSIENAYDWGLDHGTWSVLKYIYPLANIPVIQISLDRYKDAKWHYDLGKELSFLRSKGVLIIGSGNMVHNLRMINVNGYDFNEELGYEWAFEMNDIFKKNIEDNHHQSLINYRTLHKDAMLAVPTPEHYLPMMYILGLKKDNDEISIFNDRVIASSLSMTSFIIN